MNPLTRLALYWLSGAITALAQAPALHNASVPSVTAAQISRSVVECGREGFAKLPL